MHKFNAHPESTLLFMRFYAAIVPDERYLRTMCNDEEDEENFLCKSA